MKSIKKAQIASKTPDHDKFHRIKSLPAETYENVIKMLKRHSPRVVAELLQEEGFCCDIKAITLAHLLEKFRTATIPAEELLDPYLIGKLTEKFKTNVNVFAELSDLVVMQRERIRQARLAEMETGVLSPETSKQVHVMTRLLKTYGDLGCKAGLLNEFIEKFRKDTSEEQELMYCTTETLFFNLFKKMNRDHPELADAALELALEADVE